MKLKTVRLLQHLMELQSIDLKGRVAICGQHYQQSFEAILSMLFLRYIENKNEQSANLAPLLDSGILKIGTLFKAEVLLDLFKSAVE